jgi:hypothetical protein
MTVLIDTHTLLWFLKDDPLLSTNAKSMIEDPLNRKLVSVGLVMGNRDQGGLGQAGSRRTEPLAFGARASAE